MRDAAPQKGVRVEDQTPSASESMVTTRALYNGFGNTLARAFELVVTPALFAVIGHFIDRWLGTGFVFTLALTVFCVVGMSIRMVYGYIDAMKQHEAEAVWRRQKAIP